MKLELLDLGRRSKAEQDPCIIDGFLVLHGMQRRIGCERTRRPDSEYHICLVVYR